MKFKFLIIIAAISLLWVGCADEDLKPIITFDDAGKGAYPALVESTGGDIKSDDLGGSVFSYTIEFIDLEGGDLVAEYKTEVSFTDFDESDGNSSAGPVALQSFSSGEFSAQTSGNKGLSVTVTGAELASALGLTADDLKGGGQFDVAGTVTTVDGAVFRSTNSSAAVNGSAFRGFFDYTLFIVCPSDLAGTYTYATQGSSTDPCCPGTVTVDGEVTLTDNGGGEYTISDWSGGLYVAWYGPDGGNYGIDAPVEGVIKDACNVMSFVTDSEPFGEWLKGSGRVDAETGVITLTWENGWGDKGESTLTPK